MKLDGNERSREQHLKTLLIIFDLRLIEYNKVARTGEDQKNLKMSEFIEYDTQLQNA